LETIENAAKYCLGLKGKDIVSSKINFLETEAIRQETKLRKENRKHIFLQPTLLGSNNTHVSLPT